MSDAAQGRALVLAALLLVPVGAVAQQISTARHAGKRITICQVDLSQSRLELFWRDGAKQPFRTFTRLEQWLRGRGRKLVFAINAGMYREDFSPVGLYVEGGKQLRPLNTASGKTNFCLKPNGVFMITRNGAAVVESSRYAAVKSSAVYATQSGPMLVLDGRLHPAFRAGSESRLIRNGVGVVSPRKVVFALSEDPVNFHEFATFFRDRLHCRNALFLDGSISALYSAPLARNSQFVELGPMLAITSPGR